MQAIVTKYIGASNVKGSRIKATAQAGSITLQWENRWNADANHCAAAKALAVKLGWAYGTYHSGGLPDGSRVWVCEEHSSREGQDHFVLTLGQEVA